MELQEMPNRSRSAIVNMDGSPPDYTPEHTEQPAQRKRRYIAKGYYLPALAICATVLATVLLIHYLPPNYPKYPKLHYQLKDTYNGTTFFDNFDYFTGYDPSQGFVHYVDRESSAQQNLTFASSDSAVLRVMIDDPGAAADTGRKSVRIHSKKKYNKNSLFIFDILHTPYGCGSWPALWTTDPDNWPRNGEIDVVEAVNQGNSGNQMSLHTSDRCHMDVTRKQIGEVLSKDCHNSTKSNEGCGVRGPVATYGPALNDMGGGVYAMELLSAGIRVWYFSRTTIPTDIRDGISPKPSSWGEALADFPSTKCDIDHHFKNQRIIANIDLCGAWAGQEAVYSIKDRCRGTCKDLVTKNSSAFKEAYWEFKSFQVYQAR